MAWTYTDSPATVPADAVRCLIGDTDSTWPQPVSDNEIAYFLSVRQGVAEYAAADAAEKLAAFYARQADTTNGKNQVSASQRALAFRTLADDLKRRAQSLIAPVNVFAGGLTHSGNEALAADPDATQPSFAIGMDDEPGTLGTPRADW